MKKLFIYDLVLIIIILLSSLNYVIDSFLLGIILVLNVTFGFAIGLSALVVLSMIFIKYNENHEYNRKDLFYYLSSIFVTIIYLIFLIIIQII